LELAATGGVLGLLPSAVAAEAMPTQPLCSDTETTSNAELIGALLWACFHRGAAGKQIPDDVINKGRELSGPPICSNLEKYGVEGFPLNATAWCAYRAGAEAKKRAGTAPAISVANFSESWKKIRDEHREAAERLGRSTKAIERMRGGGC
jgi:hypothetical protein